MSWITALWSMLIGACVAMALPHLLVGLWRRRGAHLYFVLAAMAVIGIAVGELAMMRAATVEQFARTQQWAHLAVFLLVVGLVGFVWLHFGTARRWLGFTVIATRFVALLINFAFPPSLNFRQITALQQVPFLGESVSLPIGVFNPWTHMSELSSLLLLVFVIDASIRSWRQGTRVERRRAVTIGGSVTVFILIAAGLASLTTRQIIQVPYFISFPFAAILAAMAFELGADLLRAGQVARELAVSEASLHQSEERNALAAETAQLGVWELNPETNQVWISDKVRALFHFGPGDWVTHAKFQERVHPDDRATRQALIQQAIETKGGYEAEFRVVLPDGTVRWMGGRTRCIIGPDDRCRLLGISMDVTKRKQAEDLFRLATEAAPSGIVMVNDQGCILLVNAHVEELFGYRRDELIGQAVEVLVPDRFKAGHPEHRGSFFAAPEPRVMGAGRDLFGRRKDGTEFPLEIDLSPIETPEGILVLATVVDIATRKAGETEARHRREQVELLSRVSLLGQMTASLAHELNQPLTAIVSNANAGMRYIDKGDLDAGQLHEILADVADDGRRAHEIVQGVRSAIKKGTAIRGRINLNDVVETVTHILQQDAAAHSCAVQTSLEAGLPPIDGDPTQIQQVLINLVRNAFDAMRNTPPSRRTVHIATETISDGIVSLGVRDFGMGIPDVARDRLFEQFYTTKAEGLGMGLAIAQSIIAAHGGRIAAENVEGGGARFAFHLPASVEETE